MPAVFGLNEEKDEERESEEEGIRESPGRFRFSKLIEAVGGCEVASLRPPIGRRALELSFGLPTRLAETAKSGRPRKGEQ
jgi:hypothetical protein